MKEKRKFPRIGKAVPLKLSGLEDDILTETRNVSGSGAYCAINKPVAEMTKLDIVMLVPIRKNKIKGIKKINCKGVVVRNQFMPDDQKRPYHIGIYFNEMKDSDRQILLSYLNIKTHTPIQSTAYDHHCYS